MSDEPDVKAVAGVRRIPKLLEDKLVENFQRDCWHVSSGRLSFPGGILELLACQSTVDPELTVRLWDVVPIDLRDQLTIALREAMSPEFRLPLWLYGFPKTYAELEADAAWRTANLRAWATEFCVRVPGIRPPDRKTPDR